MFETIGFTNNIIHCTAMSSFLHLEGERKKKKAKQKVIFSVKGDNKIISVESKLRDRKKKYHHQVLPVSKLQVMIFT